VSRLATTLSRTRDSRGAHQLFPSCTVFISEQPGKLTDTSDKMKSRLVFASACPACGHQRLQHGHTRGRLINLIESRGIIDAYCLECDMLWPVSAEERRLIACKVAIKQSGTSAACMTELGDADEQCTDSCASPLRAGAAFSV